MAEKKLTINQRLNRLEKIIFLTISTEDGPQKRTFPEAYKSFVRLLEELRKDVIANG